MSLNDGFQSFTNVVHSTSSKKRIRWKCLFTNDRRIVEEINGASGTAIKQTTQNVSGQQITFHTFKLETCDVHENFQL